MKYVIPLRIMRELTGAAERNVYIHPNPFVRWIFWQRIESLGQFVDRHVPPQASGLDFGGGSGAMLQCWKSRPGRTDIVDLDATDAVNLKNRLGCSAVTVVERDLARHSVERPYDFVVAADVLEHFRDISMPITQIRRLLKPEGLLLVSLPTENRLYDFGRVLIRKSKPEDHYHSSADVLSHLVDAGFQQIEKRRVPHFGGLALPVFDIAVLRYRP